MVETLRHRSQWEVYKALWMCPQGAVGKQTPVFLFLQSINEMSGFSYAMYAYHDILPKQCSEGWTNWSWTETSKIMRKNKPFYSQIDCLSYLVTIMKTDTWELLQNLMVYSHVRNTEIFYLRLYAPYVTEEVCDFRRAYSS